MVLYSDFNFTIFSIIGSIMGTDEVAKDLVIHK